MVATFQAWSQQKQQIGVLGLAVLPKLNLHYRDVSENEF